MSKDSALKVNKGIEQPPIINPNAFKNLKKKKRIDLSVNDFITGIKEHKTTILSKAITLIESSKDEHKIKAQEIIKHCLPLSGNSIRIGITGVPGVGKSTFIESFGKYLTSKGNKVAILAIDPSSQRSKGSILGDKTRMETLSTDENAFIRPSPSAGSLGGVARKTQESIILCEAAGFNIIIIETVGVGQSEIAVHGMTDFFLLLMLAGAGDELQGMKRGIMEMADAISINKADGNNVAKANRAKAEYKSALHLFPPKESKVSPEVFTCSAIYQTGIPEIFDFIETHKKETTENGYFMQNRTMQAKYRMYESINEKLQNNFYGNIKIKKAVKEMENKVLKEEISSYEAAQELINLYQNGK